MIDSDGAISEVSEGDEPDADLTAATLSLTADTGISGSSAIETSATSITASTDEGDIDIDNDNSSGTTASLTVTTGTGNILFSQDGDGSLDVTLASTVDGSIGIDVDNATLTARTVTAGGSDIDDNVSLTTTTSGNVIVDDITAAGNTIMIYSALGAIREVSESPEVVDLTAATLNLSAATGIGATDAIETDVTSLQASSTTGDIVIVEKDDVTLNNIRAHAGNIFLEATDGGMSYGSDRIEAGAGTLTLIQKEDLDLAPFRFDNQTNTDLMVKVTDGSFTAVNSADKWKSIQAIAKDNIELQGKYDIKIGTHADFEPTNHRFDGVVTSENGGVSIISYAGKVRTAGDTILDNVAITGYSDDGAATPIGVDLLGTEQKAAIVIISQGNMNLGSSAELTADGVYYGETLDNRDSVIFKSSGPDSGDPIDVAIYLQNTNDSEHVEGNKDSDIKLGSEIVSIDNVAGIGIGTLVVDAYDTVTFTSAFEDSLKTGASNVKRIEVVSRYSETISMAKGVKRDGVFRLPHADNPDNLADGEFILSGGVYALRGTPDGKVLSLAQILKLTQPVPLVVPMPLAPEDQGQVQIERRETEVLGLGDKPELARAYPPSLNTDLNMDKAAQRLYALVPILSDNDRIAILNRIVVENWQDVDQPIAPEQEAMIAQRMSGTPAEEWVAALTEYVDVLSTMVGRPKTASVLWVMQTYVIPQAEEGLIQDQTVAFLEAQID